MNKIQVGLFHREKNKMCCTSFVRLPNDGDLIWLNRSCFKVEKIVHTYMANNSQDELYWFGPCIFLIDVCDEEFKRYNINDVDAKYDRNDDITYFTGESS